MPAAVAQEGALNIPAGATSSQIGPDINSPAARGVRVVLVSSAIGTGSVTLAVQGKDKASGTYYTLLTGIAITTNSVNVYTLFPGAAVTANQSANDCLPATWRVVVTANNANPATYTV